jgi:NAD(P)H-dependent FMN reductase
MKIGVIVGSTREGNLGSTIGEWVFKLAKDRPGATYELVDVKNFRLPLLGEVEAEVALKNWRDKIISLDGFVFITAEYNHSITASLKNALDSAFEQWFNKAAGIVSYGYAGGARAAEHLRTMLGALAIADVQHHVMFNLNTEVNETTGFTPAAYQAGLVNKLLDQVESWTKALKSIR